MSDLEATFPADQGMDGDQFDPGGEFLSIPELIVVSPAPGRFRREALREGAQIHVGTVIGQVAFNGGRSLPVISQVVGVFLGWLAWEGENIQRGTALAHIAVNGSAGNETAALNGQERHAEARNAGIPTSTAANEEDR